MGYPPCQPEVPHKCEQTENITFRHPSDAGGKKIIMTKVRDYSLTWVTFFSKFPDRFENCFSLTKLFFPIFLSAFLVK